jgi:ATP-dependent protease ClpP protease subunit
MSNGTIFLDIIGEIGRAHPHGVRATEVEEILAKHPRAKKVECWIDSPGGSLVEAKRMYSALRRHGAEVTTIAADHCASAATLVLMAGSLRLAMPNSEIVLHGAEVSPQSEDCSPSMRWTASKYRKRSEMLKRADDEVVAIYASRTGRSPKLFEREMDTESRMPLGIARSFGFFHSLVGEGRGASNLYAVGATEPHGGHVWTAPTGQGVLLAFCLRSGASHVSGLFVRRS